MEASGAHLGLDLFGCRNGQKQGTHSAKAFQYSDGSPFHESVPPLSADTETRESVETELSNLVHR